MEYKKELSPHDLPIPLPQYHCKKEDIPLVSVSCITYNHVNFIREAIEGFLMQKTTFPVKDFYLQTIPTSGQWWRNSF